MSHTIKLTECYRCVCEVGKRVEHKFPDFSELHKCQMALRVFHSCEVLLVFLCLRKTLNPYQC